MPTLPALTTRTSSTLRSYWTCVWPHTTTSRRDAGELGRDVLLRRGGRDDRVSDVGVRGRRGRPEAVDSELDRRRPPCDPVEAVGTEPRRAQRMPRRTGRPSASQTVSRSQLPCRKRDPPPSASSRSTHRPGAGRRPDRHRRRSRRRPRSAGRRARPRAPAGSRARRRAQRPAWRGRYPAAVSSAPARRPAPCRARPRADAIERRAAGAGERARRRPEVALADPCDRLPELVLERIDVGARERGETIVLGSLEELVDDLDPLGTARRQARA